MIRATLDSNICVSALQFFGVGVRLLELARARSIRIDTSHAILDETVGVLRDKFGWAAYRLHFARASVLKYANLVTPAQTIKVADDPDDDKIIECAIAAGSDFIVTYDKDLLRLDAYRGIKIVPPVNFLRRGVER